VTYSELSLSDFEISYPGLTSLKDCNASWLFPYSR